MSKYLKCEGFLASLVILLVIREKQIKIKYSGTSLMVQWLRLHAPNVGGVGLIPGQGTRGFPGGLVVRNLPANVEDGGSIPRLGRSPGEGNSNPL